ncbi:MAG TPA: hypothetical protein VM734_12900, partial [Kofleriaceae bacterium]|nr:hypothetical protein [Kofleriaceae bacterium]
VTVAPSWSPITVSTLVARASPAGRSWAGDDTATSGGGSGGRNSDRQPAPLVAVSSPAQLLPAGDARATSVLTVIGDHDGATVTLAGSGRATDPAAAEALLDGWLSLVASIPLITSARAAR